MDIMNPIDTGNISTDSSSIFILELVILHYIVALVFLVYTSKT